MRMHSEFDPDDNFAQSFRTEHDLDDEAALEQVVWQLLLLINPGDEEAAREQFERWQTAMVVQGGDDPIEPLADVIDWKSGFRVEVADTRALVESLEELASRWNLHIDWGVEDPTDDEFLDAADAESLIGTAYDRLREHHYTLWVRDAGHDLHAGWITRSEDNEAMRLVASALGIDVRPGAA
ncbi:DUF6630 family protein [Cognatilysobacter bugurensis]|uniref:DUF6630 domain-containing protein n=1 Tax=Cognatilysobacter bugurensis TaxID=543356 RepID=A0A918SUS6_9GAMM|nr:hypothetical protein [Lysobacter bugurensis]GHA72477.1 hypothetical protein GCM10007067_06220 [Lysobacter bugurensis]